MIRNLVFDMGNVLLDYDPVRYLGERLDRPEDREAILAGLFRAPEWSMTDGGVLTDEDMVALLHRRFHGRLEDTAVELFQDWDTHMREIAPGCALVADLKARGVPLYLLSNASLRWFTYCNNYPVFRLFDGIVISAREKLLKPDPAIYRVLTERFSLVPEECFFIDDLPANVAGAKSVGMDGFVLSSWDRYGELRALLRERGVL